MELSPAVRLFLKNNKDILNTSPDKIDWDDFHYNAAMNLEYWEIGELFTLLLPYDPLKGLERIPPHFLHSSPITSFEIPHTPTLTGITAGAFAFSHLERIHIPHNIKKIGAGAFEGCAYLEEVTFNNGCRDIHSNCFSACTNLSSIKLPGTLEFIGERCFWGCKSLRKLEIPHYTKTIRSEAFHGLENCVVEFEDYMDLVISANAFPPNCEEAGIRVSCYYDTPIYDYCQEYGIPFERCK